MKIRVNLNSNQTDFIKKVIKDTKYAKHTTLFIPNKDIEIDDDLAEELREMFADVEIYKIQSNEKDEEYQLASDLVDLFLN